MGILLNIRIGAVCMWRSIFTSKALEACIANGVEGRMISRYTAMVAHAVGFVQA